MRRNLPIYGFLLGAVLPCIGFYVMYMLWGHKEGVGAFLSSTTKSHDLAAKVFTLSLLINLIPFAWFTTKRKDYLAQGLFVATMLYVVAIVLIKFVW